MKKYALIPILLFAISCSGNVKQNGAFSSPVSVKKIRCLILFEEQIDGKRSFPGFTRSEEILAALLPSNIEVAEKDIAARSSKKLGIKINESMSGIVDPVIKDYLVGELDIDAILVGVVIFDSAASSASMDMKCIRLRDDFQVAAYRLPLKDVKGESLESVFQSALTSNGRGGSFLERIKNFDR